MSEDVQPELDSIWRENDPRDERYVRVHKISGADIGIVRVNSDGSHWPKSRLTWTRLDRFGRSGRIGFTFITGPKSKAEGRTP